MEIDQGVGEFDMADTISLFETEFQISIAEHQFGDLKTVGRVVDFAAEHGGDDLWRQCSRRPSNGGDRHFADP